MIKAILLFYPHGTQTSSTRLDNHELFLRYSKTGKETDRPTGLGQLLRIILGKLITDPIEQSVTTSKILYGEIGKEQNQKRVF